MIKPQKEFHEALDTQHVGVVRMQNVCITMDNGYNGCIFRDRGCGWTHGGYIGYSGYNLTSFFY